MNIEEIFSKFSNGGPRDYYSYETFVLNLLKYHVESQKKSFFLIESQREIGDAYAKDGFDDFIGLKTFPFSNS